MSGEILAPLVTAIIWLAATIGVGALAGGILAAGGIPLVSKRQTFITPSVWGRAVVIVSAVVAALAFLGSVRGATLLSLGDSWANGSPVLVWPISRHAHESLWEAANRQTAEALSMASNLRSEGPRRIIISLVAGTLYDATRGAGAIGKGLAHSNGASRFTWSQARPGIVAMLVENTGLSLILWLVGMLILAGAMVLSLLFLLLLEEHGLPSGHWAP